MTKIKVLETIRQGKIGGGESHVLTLVKELDKSLFEPIVLSFTPGPMVDELEKLGIKTHVIFTERGFDFKLTNQIKQLLIDEDIELVHNHGTRAASNLWRACKKLNIPTVYTVHGWSFHDDQSFFVKNARILSEKLITSQANQTISVSHSNQKTGQDHIRGFKSTVIRNGIDLNKFNYQAIQSSIREEYNIPENHVLIGYIVRMDIQKDPITMVKAFKEVYDQHENVTLLMIGEGPLRQETEALVKELGIGDRLILDNFRQDVPNVLAGIDIYCLPSLWEGLPIGMLEAMAMKKCIVATRVDGSKEILKDMVNGLLIEPQQPQMLAEALLKVIKNKELCDSTASNAFQTIQNEFTAVAMTKKVEELYFKVLGKQVPVSSSI
ncbi:MAG: glycosyltransferase family 4 protein [bacterium]